MLSNRSYGTLMSLTERSVQSYFKSNTYCVLLGDAQQFICGFIANIFTYTILQNQTILCLLYTTILTYYRFFVNKYHFCNWSLFIKCWESTSHNPRRVITDRLSKKYILDKKEKSATDFQSVTLQGPHVHNSP